MPLEFAKPKKLIVDAYNERTGTWIHDKVITSDLFSRMKETGEWHFHIVKDWEPTEQTKLDLLVEEGNSKSA